MSDDRITQAHAEIELGAAEPHVSGGITVAIRGDERRRTTLGDDDECVMTRGEAASSAATSIAVS